ncbi:restriction endonuclease [Rhodococcus hoagii]|nr:restriction endonuclease [Prescottella equi]
MEYITTPHAAERNAAARMRDLGFADARVTTGGSDGGIDVRSRDAIAQVKWKGGVTGRPDLQNLYGARGRSHDLRMLFFAASGYSQHAIDYAEYTEICLFTYDPIGQLTPANSWASALMTAAVHRSQSDPRPDVSWADLRRSWEEAWDLTGGAKYRLMVEAALKQYWVGVVALLFTFAVVGNLTGPQRSIAGAVVTCLLAVLCWGILAVQVVSRRRNNPRSD